MQLSKTASIPLLLVTIFIFSKSSPAREYIQLSGVIHVHTTFSSGRHSPEELVAKAEKKKIDVLILTDHDQVVMEYGLFPFRHLIKRREERTSVLQIGAEKYLAEIERINNRQQSVLIIPGVQSSPFYYWKGNPFTGKLTAYNYRKELLLIGLSAPDDYQNLPRLHGGYSTQYWRELLPRVIIFFAVFLLSIYLVLQKGIIKVCGMFVAVISIALMLNHHPFKSSKFDPYQGDQGNAPFKEVIDYAKNRGGLVFWAHPESNYSAGGVPLGPIEMKTDHYADALIETFGYTGFAALYGDTSTAANTGMHWDRVLTDYCKGRRDGPVWAIAGSDFHEDQKGFDLDTFQTIFLVDEGRTENVLNALKRGRVYAVRKSDTSRFVLEQFHLKDKPSGSAAIMGEELAISATPVIEGRLSTFDEIRREVEVTIVRGGQIAWNFSGQTPLEFHLVDNDDWRGKTYYRLDVKGKGGERLLSNPIFAVRNNA
jgi:hypothetical protein